jgi:hypothetical protein
MEPSLHLVWYTHKVIDDGHDEVCIHCGSAFARNFTDRGECYIHFRPSVEQMDRVRDLLDNEEVLRT